MEEYSSENIPSSSKALCCLSFIPLSQVGVRNVGTVEVGNVEVGNVEVGNVEVGNVEVGNVEVGNVEVGNVEVGNASITSSSASESELISMIGSFDSRENGGDGFNSSKYSEDSPFSSSSSGSDSRSTCHRKVLKKVTGKCQKKFNSESNLFHPGDGNGERSPETVYHFQNLRGSNLTMMTMMMMMMTMTMVIMMMTMMTSRS